ncbi:hypothetical protein HYDPIDRAFT_27153 [Hydnomerulius pinastri MD-312]|nr:hypothetical protein HYDPIDRAFT_27153 [Hydnomerulius pinastri MD-312]
MSNLDSFVKSSRPAPTTVATSQEIRDRGSAFVGNVYRATTPEDAKAAAHHHKHVVHAGKETLDDLLAALRVELDTLTTTSGAGESSAAEGAASPQTKETRIKSKPPDYSVMHQGLDLTKAKRLINARESAIKSVKTLIAKHQSQGVSGFMPPSGDDLDVENYGI